MPDSFRSSKLPVPAFRAGSSRQKAADFNTALSALSKLVLHLESRIVLSDAERKGCIDLVFGILEEANDAVSKI